MMKSKIIKSLSVVISFCIFFISALSAQPKPQAPKLIVNIVIDQMRQDYLFRFWDLYGEDGFKKLVNNG